MSFPYMVTFTKLTESGADQKRFRVEAPTAITAKLVAFRQLVINLDPRERGWECTDVEFLKEPGGTNAE